MPSAERDVYVFDVLNENTLLGLSETMIRKLLADRQRRRLLRYLHDHDESVEIESIIDKLAHYERQTVISETVASLIDEVTTAVWRVYLSILAAREIVKYNRESGTVRWWRNAGQLTTYLENPFQ